MREGLEWFLGVIVGLVGVAGLEEPLLRFEGLHGECMLRQHKHMYFVWEGLWEGTGGEVGSSLT